MLNSKTKMCKYFIFNIIKKDINFWRHLKPAWLHDCERLKKQYIHTHTPVWQTKGETDVGDS